MIVSSYAEAIRCHQPRPTLFIVVSDAIVPRPTILIVASRAEAICCHEPRPTLFICGILCHCTKALADGIPLNAAPLSIFWLARSPDCSTTIFQETGLISRLPLHHFLRGRRYLQIAAPSFLMRPVRFPIFAVPQFFKGLAQPPNCRTRIFLLAGTILRLPSGTIELVPKPIWAVAPPPPHIIDCS